MKYWFYRKFRRFYGPKHDHFLLNGGDVIGATHRHGTGWKDHSHPGIELGNVVPREVKHGYR